jgi:large subunit ribosomal protein L4
VKADNLLVLEDFSIEGPKTKAYLQILQSFNLDGKKSLLVLPEMNKMVYLSSRNIPKARVAVASDLNTYMIMHADKLLLVESSVKQLEETLLK